MYCKYCGRALSGEEKFCPVCGGIIDSGKGAESTGSSNSPASASVPPPVSAPAPAPIPKKTERCVRCGQVLTEQDKECPFCRYPVVRQPNVTPFYAPPVNGKKKGLAWGIVSLILAILSPVFTVLLLAIDVFPVVVCLLPFPVAAACGIVAIYKGLSSKNTPAIVTGVIGLILSVLFFVFAVIFLLIFISLYLYGSTKIY
jgi:RNA polymerase subunit RPABC4/transcription elongation factor Spt4